MMKNWIIIAFATLISLPSQAQWFESHGSAPIHNDDLESARNSAVQDALKQALLFSGAQVKSIAQISDGLLTSDRFEVRSQGSVRDLQLVSETRTDEQVKVTIRADIVAQKNQCSSGNPINHIAMTRFPIRHRQQAVTGNIFELGKQTATQLFSMLNQHKGSYKATQLLEINQALSNQATSETEFTTQIQTLTQHADAQYLLTGEITDLSMHQAKDKWYGLSSHAPKRQFSLDLTLFDGDSSRVVWQKSYATSASWLLSKYQHANVYSDEFWVSPYGMAIKAQLQMVSSDLNQQLFCSTLTGDIVNIENDALMINLGKRNGVNVGDKFNAYHTKQFIDVNGVTRQSLVLNSTTIVALEVQESHAILGSEDGKFYGDINLHDTVKKQ